MINLPFYNSTHRYQCPANGKNSSRRVLLLLLCFLILLALGETEVSHGQSQQPLVVAELYTSQGCSSCPPADENLTEISGSSFILALSFHVDYWDYIGWKDPYALGEATKRQRLYAQGMKLPYVYTPQIIINGRTEIAGMRLEEVKKAVQDARSIKKDQPGLIITQAVTQAGQNKIILPDTDSDELMDIWQLAYTPRIVTKVLRGENRGLTSVHTNVVREFAHLGTWNGTKKSIQVKNMGYEKSAILIQKPEGGSIRAAMILD